MGANQSSNVNNYNSEQYPTDNGSTRPQQRQHQHGLHSKPVGDSFPMTNSAPLSLAPLEAAPSAVQFSDEQQKCSTTTMACSPRLSKDVLRKSKPQNGKISVTKESVMPQSLNTSDTVSHDETLMQNHTEFTRGTTSNPIRSSILRGSFRRVKALNNVPPPVIPDDKFNRLSNVSLGSSGFGGGSSQESTASTDSSASSASSTASSSGGGNMVLSLGAGNRTTSPLTNQTAAAVPQPENAAARKARMNLKLNIVMPSTASNPPVSASGFNGNGSFDNPYGQNSQISTAAAASSVKFNLPPSPFNSPVASPLFNPGNDSPISSDFATTGYRSRNETMSKHNRQPASNNTFHPEAPISVVVMGDNLRSPTTTSSSRADYVELMCTDARHSRSSFSSFDGSNYSNSSFNNSPNNILTLDINAMFQSGMNDNEVLSAWLGSIAFTEYFPNFIQAGYDMPTAVRMTTEDLTAIGITKPNHRKRIRAEIARLPNVDLSFGCDLPDTAAQFLQATGLSDYLGLFLNQNYQTFDKILNLTWEDLEEIGVKRLGHLKKLSLAIKHFRGLRRQTAQSLALEDEARRFSSQYSGQDGHNSSTNGAITDDDKSSSTSQSRSSLNDTSSPRRSKLFTRPVLTTFQALPSPLKETHSEVLWRPRSAMGRHSSPLVLSPDCEEISESWNGTTHSHPHTAVVVETHTPATPLVDESIAVINNGNCTLPRRKSVKSGGTSFARMMAQVFRSDKGPSTPSSPKREKDHTDSSVKSKYITDRLPSPTKSVPLASFVNPKIPPPVSLTRQQSSSGSRRDLSPISLETTEMGSLSQFPPPPSPLLRDYPPEVESDMEKTPTFQHRILPMATFDHLNSISNGYGITRNHPQSSLPFAQDNIGTIRQRNGRSIPTVSNATFRDPSVMKGDESGDMVLDEITGMLATLTDELDEAMCQLESAAQ